MAVMLGAIGITNSVPQPWPTREKWAEHRRSFYNDEADPNQVPYDRRLSQFASPEEAAAVIAELEQLHRKLGRQMQAARKQIGPLLPQPGETGSDRVSRYLGMSATDQELAGNLYYEPQAQRSYIREALDYLRRGEVPWRRSVEAPRLNVICNRCDAAYQAACDAKRREVQATPVDDEAWQEELVRRRQMAADHPNWYSAQVEGD